MESTQTTQKEKTMITIGHDATTNKSVRFFNMTAAQENDWCEANLKHGKRGFISCAYLNTKETEAFVKFGRKKFRA